MAEVADVPAKRGRKNTKKVLDQKKSTTNEANILAQTLAADSSPSVVPPPSSSDADSMKENRDSISSSKKGKAVKGGKQKPSFEKEMEEMQEMLQQLKLEKEKTEEMLKEKDEMLKAREDELENKGKEQEKLQSELKKLQKLKEFKPTLHFQILKDNEPDDKSRNKKKKKKDGTEMKRPSTPYILWSKDQWAEIKKANPNADFKETSNILGAKWKTVTAEEKKPYEEKYRAEKEAYLKVMAMEKRETEAMRLLEEEQKQKTAMELLEQYVQFMNEADDQGTKKTKKERDPLKPKQPTSAFFIFSNERRAALVAETENKTENKSVTEFAKLAGEEWKTMTEKQKAPYEEMAKKNKEKYLIEMEAYKLKKEEEAMTVKKEEEEVLKLQRQEAMQLLKKKEKTDNIIQKTKEEMQKKKKSKNIAADPNKPKKPATSFLLFSKEERKKLMLQERPGSNNSTLTAQISVKWKELNEEVRKIWNAKAAEGMEVYKKQMEEYNETRGSQNPH